MKVAQEVGIVDKASKKGAQMLAMVGLQAAAKKVN